MIYVSDSESPLHDLVWGAEAIAKELNLPKRKAFYHLARGNLPARKVGSSWVASRAQLWAAVLGETEKAA